VVLHEQRQKEVRKKEDKVMFANDGVSPVGTAAPSFVAEQVNRTSTEKNVLVF
jgi:hypothetical protein